MHFGEALGLLALLTVAAIVLRFNWFRMPHALQKRLLIGCAIVFSIRFVFLISQWSTTLEHFNSILFWLAVAAYQIILVRFSLMQPRWLTSLCAIILLLPLIGSTLLLPLTRIFETEPHEVRRLARNYVIERSHWDATISGHDGDDFTVFYNPSLLPFFHRVSQRSSFSKLQCNTDAATVEVNQPKRLVHFRCPGYKGKTDDISVMLPLK